MGSDDNKVIRIAPKETEKIRKEEIRKYGKIISEFSHELSCINSAVLKQSEGLLIFLIQKFGINKTKKVVKNLSSSTYEHLFSIYSNDCGKTLIMALNEVKELSYTRIIDLFKALYELYIEDKEGIKVLSKVSTLLKGQDNLLKAVKVKDDYVRNIIYNRPYFSFSSKVNCILNAAKVSDGTHIIKYRNAFLNTERDGNITDEVNNSIEESRALGLFVDDMRFISQYELKILTLSNHELQHEFVSSENHNFWSQDKNIYNNQVIAKRKRVINGALFEIIELTNKGLNDLKADMVISSVIKDIFEVRGKIRSNTPPARVEIDCDGNILINTPLEGNTYGVKLTLKEKNNWICPASVEEESARIIYQLALSPGHTRKISLKIQPLLNHHPYIDGEVTYDSPDSYEEAFALIENTKKAVFAQIIVDGDIPEMQKTIDKCLKDLNMLVNHVNIDGRLYSYIAAGLPRYSALFGRDSIITALQTFPLNQDITKDTLELLARFQGMTFEERFQRELAEIKETGWNLFVKNAAIKGMRDLYLQREEAPGRILHELRVGELANVGVIPYSPYYGTVDATPLWIILFAEYYKWTLDRSFMQRLLPNAQAALDWINSNMADGYLRSSSSMYSRVKIQNQCWKDAEDSLRHIVNVKGNLCDPDYPVALAEVQGYVYRAFIMMSEIYRNSGDDAKADSLIEQADELKIRFNRDFWLEDEQFYTMSLDRNNKPIQNITSNIGHCLTMGIIDEDKTNIIEKKLMSNNMNTGWGIRTLGSNCHAYDPISYNNGSVWVHDSAFVAMGLSPESRAIIAKGLFEAANMFQDNRLPELFGGFERKNSDTYIENYPEDCSPQAWASGSLIWLLLNIIGLKVNNHEIELVGSYIPDWLKSVSIKGIKIADKVVDINKTYKQG